MARIKDSKILQHTGIPSLRDACIVLVKTAWNAAVTDELEKACRRRLQESGVEDIITLTVPGAVEIPFSIQHYQANHKNKVDAYIALGCVIRGGTPHFEYVCRMVADGVMQLNLQLPVPVIFGVLTVDTMEQAQERLGGEHGHKGTEAAATAEKMIAFTRQTAKQKK